jgi:hypothetical protein
MNDSREKVSQSLAKILKGRKSPLQEFFTSPFVSAPYAEPEEMVAEPLA